MVRVVMKMVENYLHTYYAKKTPFIDVAAVPHLPECSMTPRVQRL